MATIEQRVAALEKIIDSRKPTKPVQFVVLDIEGDDPEEYKLKQQQIEAIRAAGDDVIVFTVV